MNLKDYWGKAPDEQREIMEAAASKADARCMMRVIRPCRNGKHQPADPSADKTCCLVCNIVIEQEEKPDEH